jgi:hypothetical protein
MAFSCDLLPSETSIFQLEGFYTLLLGQQVPHRRVKPMTPNEQLVLAGLRRVNTAEAQAGMDVVESLALIRGPHWRWTPNFYC